MVGFRGKKPILLKKSLALFRHQIYGHYRKRALTPKTQDLVEKTLKPLLIDLEQLKQPKKLFSFSPKVIWLEIGFGSGDYLNAQINAHPEIGFIGCEPYLNGVAKFLRSSSGAKNIRLYDGNAKDLLNLLPDNSIEKVILLYPDPWPKHRHAYRRFIQTQTLTELTRIIAPSGKLLFASDDSQLTAWVLAHFLANNNWVWQPNLNQKPTKPFWTRYETKAALLGRSAIRLVFMKKTCYK